MYIVLTIVHGWLPCILWHQTKVFLTSLGVNIINHFKIKPRRKNLEVSVLVMVSCRYRQSNYFKLGTEGINRLPKVTLQDWREKIKWFPSGPLSQEPETSGDPSQQEEHLRAPYTELNPEYVQTPQFLLKKLT